MVVRLQVDLNELGHSALISYSVKEKPVILSISQQVGSPGDVISIRGKFFNNTKDTSYVEIAGNRLTESSYVSWNDDEIVITIPANTQDGLLYVVSNAGRSNPDFFANKTAIPVSIQYDSNYTLPTITSISSDSLYVGELFPGRFSADSIGLYQKNDSNGWFFTAM